jgi:hypothetical protein
LTKFLERDVPVLPEGGGFPLVPEGPEGPDDVGTGVLGFDDVI